MNRFRLIIVSLMVSVLCLAASCKGGGGSDDPQPNPPINNGGNNGDKPDNKPSNSAKYLTAAEFVGSTWHGKQDQLNVQSQLCVDDNEQFRVTYYVKAALSKNTGETYKKVVVAVKPYTFDPATGKFSGTGDDGMAYSGELTSKTSLNLTIPGETFKMDKD